MFWKIFILATRYCNIYIHYTVLPRHITPLFYLQARLLADNFLKYIKR